MNSYVCFKGFFEICEISVSQANSTCDSCFHNRASCDHKMGWFQYIWHSKSCWISFRTILFCKTYGMRQSHDLKHIGSQNAKQLTKVVLSIQHKAVRLSVGLICTTWVRSFGFCDPIFFKSWDRHSNMTSTKITNLNFWIKNNIIGYFIQNSTTVRSDIFS